MNETKDIKEAFPIDLNELKYTIKIEVCKNSNKFIIEYPSGKEDNGTTYQEVIGVLEIVKDGFLNSHRQEIIKSQKEKINQNA